MAAATTGCGDLNGYLNRRVLVKLHGGREVEGVLRGHDSVVNLVLDDTWETLLPLKSSLDNGFEEPLDEFVAAPDVGEKRRYLGLVIAKGTSVVLVAPAEGVLETTPSPAPSP